MQYPARNDENIHNTINKRQQNLFIWYSINNFTNVSEILFCVIF